MNAKTLMAFGIMVGVSSFVQAQVIYNGNGDTGFGGTIGNGTLTLTDDGTTVTGSLTTGANSFNNGLVIYLQSGPGGFTSTAGFNDNADGNRSGISGYGGPGQQSVMTFMSGFAPNYALSLFPDSGNNFGGLWALANGGGNSLPFVASANLNPVNSSSPGTYTFSFPVADIGLTPNSGQSFELFGTYISNTGYRSTEAIAGNDTGVQGWNPFTQNAFGTYTIAVPEPSTLAVFGFCGLAALALRRRQ